MLIAIITAVALIAFILLIIAICVYFPKTKKLGSLQKLLKAKKYKQLIKQCSSILQKNPGNWRVRYLLGKAYLGENQHNLALSELNTVSKTAVFDNITSEIDFRNILSHLLFKFQYYDKAFEELALLVKLQPTNADVFYKIAHIFETNNNTEKAKRYYERCIELNSQHSEAYAALGLLRYKNHELVEAEKLIHEAIRLDAENATVLYYSAKIAASKKEYGYALSTFEKASKDSSLRAKCYLEKARCYFEAGDTEKTKYECERCIDIAKENDSCLLYARYLLATCYEKERRLEKALEQWLLIEKVNPRFKDIAQKIADYSDIEQHDGIKEYLTSSHQHFIKIVSHVTDTKLNLDVISQKQIPEGVVIIAKTRDTKQWLNVRTRTFCLYFYRTDNLISLPDMQNIYEYIKGKSIDQAYIFTPIGYTKEAKQFAENRPFELYDKRKMETLF